MSTRAYATKSHKTPLAPFTIERRDPRENDVAIDVLFCGVCHSDVHQARNEWGNAIYPMVPGHEIIGRVSGVGAKVTRFRPGDVVGVGCMVDSCRTCSSCKQDLEQYCEVGFVATYNAVEQDKKTVTYGGYSERVVVDQHFVLSVPEKLDLAGAAPLLCAGITTYSPLRHWGVGSGKRVAVVGLGGLGHMGVKLARAMGAEVAVVTTSAKKKEDAQKLGASEVILSSDAASMARQGGRFDFVLDTVSAPHDINAILGLARRDGVIVLVGAPDKPLSVAGFNLVMGRRTFAGSLIGGIRETQEMLDFCGQHGIVSDVEVISIKSINAAYDRVVKGDVKYRFVIDLATLRA